MKHHRSGFGGKNLHHVPGFKPKRDRRVPTKNAVLCPTCKAEIGDPCLNYEGVIQKTCHPLRRKMAVRKMNEERSSESS